jgi:hypothetical protein
MAAHENTAPGAGIVRRNGKILISALAALVIQLALVAAWTGAMGKPTLREEPVGLVAPPTAAGLTVRPADAVTWRTLSDPARARQAVRTGELAGAVLLDGRRETVLLASAGGPVAAQALTKAFTAQAQTDRMALQVRDLRPLSSGDPRGLSVFVLVLAWVIGGYLGAILLVRAFGPRVRTLRGLAGLLLAQAGYAVAAAALGVLLVDPLMGVITGHAAALIGIGALVLFAVGAFAISLLTMLGGAGLIVAVATVVLLGNPVSGGTVPTSMLPSGWHFLSEILPNAAGVRLVRDVSYFGSHGIDDPLIVLAIYAGVSLLLATLVTVRRRAAAKVHQTAIAHARHSAPVVSAS